MKKVLFVCIHNSARSQMAEMFANVLGEGKISAKSAGLEPGNLNPDVVKAMAEIGIDMSQNETKSVFDLYKTGEKFHYIVTVCDKEAAERCPIFPGVAQRLHWSFPDPSQFEGSEEEKMIRVRDVRNAIKTQIEEWLNNVA